ncbi:hypothetical protein [Mesorhizobium sp. CAU 1741]|uniref:hypothetical protein n=1 Tax=Mesorhizobium sp. CAU 1741 TaxID=3140366 RepID=UPI00325A913C
MAERHATQHEWRDQQSHYYFLIALCLLGLAFVFAIAFALSGEQLDFYVGESGPVQVLSAGGYLTAIVAMWRETGSRFIWRHPYFAVIPAVMCMRELDMHNRFTTVSLTKSTFYTSSQVPLLEKAIGIVIVALLAWCVIAMLVRHTRAFLDALRSAQAYAYALFLAGAFGVVAKSVDGIASKLEPFGIAITPKLEQVAIVSEEVLELGIPVFFLVAVFAWATQRKA